MSTTTIKHFEIPVGQAQVGTIYIVTFVVDKCIKGKFTARLTKLTPLPSGVTFKTSWDNGVTLEGDVICLREVQCTCYVCREQDIAYGPISSQSEEI